MDGWMKHLGNRNFLRFLPFDKSSSAKVGGKKATKSVRGLQPEDVRSGVGADGQVGGGHPAPRPSPREAGGHSSGKWGLARGRASRRPRRRLRTGKRRAVREGAAASGLCGRGARGGAWPAGGAPPPPGAREPAALLAVLLARRAQAARARASPAPPRVAAAAAPPLQLHSQEQR
ncbi:hypothetical protein H8959_012228 [Pygathrix nigripes]